MFYSHFSSRFTSSTHYLFFSDIPSISTAPTNSPSIQPSSSTGPTLTGSMYPSFSAHPSSHPTAMPSVSPSSSPTNVASEIPSVSTKPSNMPSSSPSTSSEPSTAVSIGSLTKCDSFHIISHNLISCQYINVSTAHRESIYLKLAIPQSKSKP